MNSSVLERGEEGVDQEGVCFAGKCNHWRKREVKRTSMEGVGGGVVDNEGGGGWSVRQEEERLRPRVARTMGGLRFVDEARARVWGGGQRDMEEMR